MDLKNIIIFTFPAITLIGLITNTISFVIFSRKRFQNTIFSTYYRLFILFQSLNLIILPINKMLELNFNIYFSKISSFSCKLRFFYPNFNFSNAAWLLLAISIDRYLSITNSNKFLFRKRPQFQILTCCCIFLYNACFFTSSWFYYLKETTFNQTNQTKTSYKCVVSSIHVDLMEFFQQILCPSFFTILFTIFTIKNVFQSRKITHSYSSTNSTTKTIRVDRKFFISSITINVLFLLLNLPYFMFSILNDYTNLFIDQNDYYLFKYFESISYFCLYINLSLTFFINYFVNSMFKMELKMMFFKKD
jgi:hypothetical protein